MATEPHSNPEHHPVEVDLAVTDADGEKTIITEEIEDGPRPGHPVEVELTVTDADGDTTTVTEEITADKKPHPKLVEVTLTVTGPDGNTTTTEKEIPAGETPVLTLKQELGVPATESLFLVNKDGKRKLLADHEHHNVKAGDHFEVVGKGGVS